MKNARVAAGWAVVISALAVVWLPPYFVTQDGPSLLYFSSWFSSQQLPFHHSFSPNFQLQPNWVAPLLCGGLQNFFEGNTAEKVLASLYLLAFFWGAKTLCSKLNPNIAGMWLLLAPLAVGQAFFKGFYNNNLSLAALLWFLVVYETIKARPTLLKTMAGLMVLLFIFFSQPLPLLALFALFAIDFYRLPSLRRWLCGLACLPTFLLAWWVWASPPLSPYWRPFLHQSGDLLRGDFLNSFGEQQCWFPLSYYALLLAWAVIGFRQWVAAPLSQFTPVLVGAAVLLLYFVLPANAAGGGLINIRLATMFFVFLCLFPVQKSIAIARVSVVLAALATVLVIASYQNLRSQYRLSAEVEDMMRLAPYVNSGSMETRVQIGHKNAESDGISSKLPLLAHQPLLLCLRQGLLSPDCHFARVPYYPLSYKHQPIAGYLIATGNPPYRWLLCWPQPEAMQARHETLLTTSGRWSLFGVKAKSSEPR